MVVEKTYQRTPLGYDGSKKTSRRLPDLLPHVMQKLASLYKTQPLIVLSYWPEVVGKDIAPFTQAHRFDEGVMHVKVKNSSLLSLLNSPSDKMRLLEALREKVPGIVLKNIIFRIG